MCKVFHVNWGTVQLGWNFECPLSTVDHPLGIAVDISSGHLPQAFKRALIFLIFLIFCQRSLFSLFKLQIPKNPLFFHENPNFTIIFSISKTSLAKKSKSSQIKLYIVYFQIVIVLNQCISVKTCCGYQHYSAWICVPYGYFEILNTRVDTYGLLCNLYMVFYVTCW